jgi:hypothetical protein
MKKLTDIAVALARADERILAVTTRLHSNRSGRQAGRALALASTRKHGSLTNPAIFGPDDARHDAARMLSTRRQCRRDQQAY